MHTGLIEVSVGFRHPFAVVHNREHVQNNQ